VVGQDIVLAKNLKQCYSIGCPDKSIGELRFNHSIWVPKCIGCLRKHILYLQPDCTVEFKRKGQSKVWIWK
jgi:hypothetical protein